MQYEFSRVVFLSFLFLVCRGTGLSKVVNRDNVELRYRIADQHAKRTKESSVGIIESGRKHVSSAAAGH